MSDPNTSGDDYKDMTELDWVEYEFATIEYDYRVHAEAARRIRCLFKRLYDSNGVKKEQSNG